ncbi:hypothetical protein [Sigmofec virus UA08Rod_5228]|uniref:Uncharacterized protein n=1 Tax=Sigmofec virus UA08Rod_5228 TaxID=2929416 RepID=A0A976R707_9VIRU|nr:hypothetical protein [Sigmofec virus UA08Rod_5228]
MIKIKQLLQAYDVIQRAKIEQELITENKKIQQAINGHYTCYNRCYYLKYSPEEKELITKIIRNYMITIKPEPWSPTKKDYKIDKITRILTKLEKNSIFWKLENKI